MGFFYSRIAIILAFILCFSQILPPLAQAAICDDRGNCIEGEANRIIPLYGAFSEILLALGAKDKIVARTLADADIPEISGLPAIGTHMRPNTELILAAKPDLILQARGRKEASLLTDHLREMGLNVLEFDITDFSKLLDATRKLGELTNTDSTQLVSDWQTRLSSIKKADSTPSVYFEAREPNLLAAGRGSITNAIIEAAGGKNIITTSKKMQRFDEEMLLLADPDFCVIQKGPMNPAPRPLEERENLKSLRCARPGRNLVVDEREFSRPGPRNIAAVERLARFFREQQ